MFQWCKRGLCLWQFLKAMYVFCKTIQLPPSPVHPTLNLTWFFVSVFDSFWLISVVFWYNYLTVSPHWKWTADPTILPYYHLSSYSERVPRWLSGKESTCQHRRCRFNPWVQKIPWRRKWQPTLVFLLKNPMDRGEGWSLWDLKEAGHDLTTKQQRQGNHISKKTLTPVVVIWRGK